MSDRRVLRHIETGATGEAGWFFLQLHEDSRRMVCVRCEHCKTAGRLFHHSIDRTGEVNASINCCEPGHAFYVLEGWPPNLAKDREAEYVREVA